MENSEAEKIHQLVASYQLFHGLKSKDIDDILQYTHQCKVSKNEYLFRQGEESEMMYVLLSGQMKLTQLNVEGAQIIINYFNPGNGLGIIIALSKIPYPLSAEAVEDSKLLVWSRADMRQLMLQYPILALNSMDMIGGRFARLQEQFHELATQRVEIRVARAIARLVRQFGKQVEEGVEIDIPLMREDLAQMTGTNLYQISRILSKWEHAGLAFTKQKHIVILKPHQFITLAEDVG